MGWFAGMMDNLDLIEMGGDDNQTIYNIAVMDGINEQLAAAKHRVSHFNVGVSPCLSVLIAALSWHPSLYLCH